MYEKFLNENKRYFDSNFTLISDWKPIAGFKGGGLFFYGLLMGQNQNAIFAFDNLFKNLIRSERKMARVLEIGSGQGGLSVLLRLASLNYGFNFIAYDICNPGYQKLFEALNIDFRQKDCFEYEDEIAKEIKKEGISILICDGGNKPREFNIFAQYLKIGDIILAHDFNLNSRKFQKQKYWSFMEIRENEIIESCHKNNLKDYMEKEFRMSAYVCKVKLS
jgi:hypothetical protein